VEWSNWSRAAFITHQFEGTRQEKPETFLIETSRAAINPEDSRVAHPAQSKPGRKDEKIYLARFRASRRDRDLAASRSRRSARTKTDVKVAQEGLRALNNFPPPPCALGCESRGYNRSGMVKRGPRKQFFLVTATLANWERGYWGNCPMCHHLPLDRQRRQNIADQIRMSCDIVDGAISAESSKPKKRRHDPPRHRLAKNSTRTLCQKLSLSRAMASNRPAALIKEGIRVNVRLFFVRLGRRCRARAGAYIISPSVGVSMNIGQNGHGTPDPQHRTI